ncbi:hypothetical protein CC86DRAFT_266837, partial [Ophiobolus disseminans]
MAPIDDAIADLESQEPGERSTLKAIAEKYGVNRSTLGRRWRGVTSSKQDGYAAQQKLSPQQEQALVRYVGDLTARGLPPTRAMIRNFACNISKSPVSK